jgi:hypothetical protein
MQMGAECGSFHSLSSSLEPVLTVSISIHAFITGIGVKFDDYDVNAFWMVLEETCVMFFGK